MADAARRGATSSLGYSIMSTPAAERLKQEALAFAAVHAERLLASAGRRFGAASTTFNDLVEGRNPPGLMKLVREYGRKYAEGKGPVRSAVEIGASHLGNKVKDKVKNKVKDAVPRLGDSKRKTGGGKRKTGGKDKFVTVAEDIDIGVPVHEAYNQWTRFQEFSTFAKGVQDGDVIDDTSTTWRAKILWSTRSWTGTTTEQIPDQRVAWTSEGAKGTTKGVVTFHPLGEDLTKVLLVLEYYPKGFLEKTANIWRAQGRRARLDLKHFRHFVTMRGEIQDGEVVLSREDAVAEEGYELGPHDEEFEDGEYAEPYDDAEEDEDYPEEEYPEDLAEDEDEEYDEDEPAEDLADEEEYDDDFAEDEEEEYDEDEPAEDLADEEEYDEEYEPDELVKPQPKRGQRT